MRGIAIQSYPATCVVTAEDDSGFARRAGTQHDWGCSADAAEIDRGMACPGESAIVTVALSKNSVASARARGIEHRQKSRMAVSFLSLNTASTLTRPP